MRLYIDTCGHNLPIWRGAGERARIAAHTEVGVIELAVAADGSWSITEAPRSGEAGRFRTVARGKYGEPASVTHYQGMP